MVWLVRHLRGEGIHHHWRRSGNIQAGLELGGRHGPPSTSTTADHLAHDMVNLASELVRRRIPVELVEEGVRAHFSQDVFTLLIKSDLNSN